MSVRAARKFIEPRGQSPYPGGVMADFFDTHAHLDFPDFAGDLDQVVDRALSAGITRILCVGTTLESSRRVVDLADRFPNLFAVVGVHPNHVDEAPDEIIEPLEVLGRHPKVVAIGETGLDTYRLPTGVTPAEIERLKARQRSLFQQQLEVAGRLGLNCVIHQREAFAETLEILETVRGKVRGVFHCFTGTPQEAQKVLDLGSLVSFTGITTFKNAQNVRDALAVVPLGRFMLETDCPFLAPLPHRGKRCEPAFVRDLARAVAGYKGCSEEELSAATCATAREFFKRLT
ncbi:MAG: TatD family hydrolase [Verrucomicrobiales bacterium]|nr:TatD family hydrolase [Verrucomicrobiales bacterium]